MSLPSQDGGAKGLHHTLSSYSHRSHHEPWADMDHEVSNERLKQLLQPGRLFADKYRVERPLGAGSFALVVHAVHDVMDRDVAIKILKPKVLRKNPDVAKRFIREVQIASKLDHPNIVQIYDFGRTPEGVAYMVMEYLDGVTVHDVLSSEGRFIEPRALDICLQVLDCLAEAHDHGVIHRDLKPQNVMLVGERVSGADRVKILDFGVAKIVDERDQRDLTEAPKPRSTKFIGTPIYMSPEQILGQQVLASSDLYALGLLLYEMLVGTSPIEATQVAEVVHQHLDARALPFKGLEMISAPVREIILKATRRYPEDRFQSAREFRRALEVISDLGPSPALSQTSSRPERATPAPLDPFEVLDDEPSEQLPDVFRGSNYIGDDISGEFEPLLESRTGSRPGTRTARRFQSTAPGDARHNVAAEQQAEVEPVRPRPQEELELDIDRVKQADLHRRTAHRKAHSTMAGARAGVQRPHSRDTGEAEVSTGLVVVYIAGAAVGLYLAFVLLSLAAFRLPGPTRAFIGLLPVLAAGLWAGFATVPKTARASFRRRWLVPFCRNLMLVALVAALLLALTIPETMSSRLLEEGAWFLSEDTDMIGAQGVRRVTLAVAKALSSVYSAIAAVIPW